MSKKDEEQDITIGEIREISFNNLNYSVAVKSSYKEDTMEKLKKTALDILKDIQEVK